jgi:proteasome-associated ATPase
MSAPEKKQEASEQELLQMLGGGKLTLEQETAAVEGIGRRNPAAVTPLAIFCLHQKAKLAEELAQATRALEELHGKLTEPPWHPARYLGAVPAAPGRALVAAHGQRFAVALSPEADPALLERGGSVYLNSSMNVLLGPAPDISCPGAVGVFARRHNGRAVVRGPSGEELVVDLGEEVRNGLENGSLLLYDRDNMIAIERVEAPPQGEDLLVDLPIDQSIDQLGGLGEVFQDMAGEILLHLAHPEVVAAHALEAVKGILLTGPPGCGKTSLVRALASYLREHSGLKVRLLLFPPGAHRGPLYGTTEERIRRMFAHAKRVAEQEGCYVCLFVDDMDQLGSREDSSVNAIDSRMIPVFLQEFEALRSVNRIMLLAATNRPDILDEALTRAGRIDRVFRIPRPGRSAAREIFRKYLLPGLPYRVDGAQGAEAAEILTEHALSALYAEHGDLHVLGQLVLRDATRRPVVAPEVLSGAMIRNAVTAAKRRSCFRALHGQAAGLGTADILESMSGELAVIARGMRPGPALRQMLQLPTDLDVVKVELPPAGQAQRRYRYVRLG